MGKNPQEAANLAQDAAMKAFNETLINLGWTKKGSYVYENSDGTTITSWYGPDVTVRTERSRSKKVSN